CCQTASTLPGSRGLTAIEGSASELSVGSPGKLQPCGKGVEPETICASWTRAGSAAATPWPATATSPPANMKTAAALLTAASVADRRPDPSRSFLRRYQTRDELAQGAPQLSGTYPALPQVDQKIG